MVLQLSIRMEGPEREENVNRRKKRSILIAALAIGVCMTQASQIPAYAIGPGEAVVIDKERIPASLTDGVLEYRELGDMIHHFSPAVEPVSVGTERVREKYTAVLSTLEAEREDWRQQAKDAKEEGKAEEYANFVMQEKICLSAMKAYRKMIKKLDSHSATKTRRQMEKTMTNAAQSLMISYEMLRLQKEVAEQARELKKGQADFVRFGNQAGTATQADILNADRELAEAEKELGTVSANLETLYQELCYMTGQPSDGSLVIGTVPEGDLEAPAKFCLEDDIKKAVSNHDTVIGIRSGKTKGTAAREDKFRRLEDAEERVAMAVKQLYENVKQKEQEYRTARLRLEKEEQFQRLLGQKKRMGAVSEQEYLAGALGFKQQNLSCRMAGLEFLQAIESYKWALEGITDISG